MGLLGPSQSVGEPGFGPTVALASARLKNPFIAAFHLVQQVWTAGPKHHRHPHRHYCWLDHLGPGTKFACAPDHLSYAVFICLGPASPHPSSLPVLITYNLFHLHAAICWLSKPNSTQSCRLPCPVDRSTALSSIRPLTHLSLFVVCLGHRIPGNFLQSEPQPRA